MSFLPVGDYGVIGDLHTAALVGRNGSIDWLCAPRFDSPSVFAALLDQVRGGRWCIAPTVPATTEHRYLPGTNILVTTFRIESGGVLVVTDFMPAGPAREGRTEIHRRVQCTRGACEAEVVFEPRFDYGTRQPFLARRACGVLATDAEDDVATLSSAPDVSWQIEQARATARLSLATDEAAWFVLRCDDDEVYAVAHYRSQEKLDATARWWDEWSSRLQYQGPYRQEVERSALALKLCCYEPSGAIIAAPTTSLPETPGGAAGGTGTIATPGCGMRRSCCSRSTAWGSTPRRTGSCSSSSGCVGGPTRVTYRSCTAWMAGATCRSRCSSISTGTAVRGRCAWATARPSSLSSTSTASCSTPSTSGGAITP